MKNWFNYFYKCIVVLLMILFLYVFYFYEKKNSDKTKTGRYIPVPMLYIGGNGEFSSGSDFTIRSMPSYVIIDTETGNSYYESGKLCHEFIISK